MVAYKYTTKCSTPVQLFPLNTLIFYTHILNKERTVNIIEIFVKFPLFSKENITGCCCISRLDSRFLIDKDRLILYLDVGGLAWEQEVPEGGVPDLCALNERHLWDSVRPSPTDQPWQHFMGLGSVWGEWLHSTISGTINCSTVYSVVNSVTLNAQ